jgi:hypothetical protein
MWTPSKTKKEREEKVRSLLLKDNRAVVRAVLAIYHRQTLDEKASESTKETNYQGFCANDATLMTMYAKQILQHGGLSSQQIKIARDRMVRYRRQLAEIAELYEKRKMCGSD